MILIINSEGKKLFEIKEKDFPLYIEIKSINSLKTIYKLLITQNQKLLLNK